MTKKSIKPVHPGVYLKELLDELKLSQYRLGKDLGISAMRINYVINGKRPVNAELALRLGRYFQPGATLLDEPAKPLRYGYN